MHKHYPQVDTDDLRAAMNNWSNALLDATTAIGLFGKAHDTAASGSVYYPPFSLRPAKPLPKLSIPIDFALRALVLQIEAELKLSHIKRVEGNKVHDINFRLSSRNRVRLKQRRLYLNRIRYPNPSRQKRYRKSRRFEAQTL